MLSIRQVSKHFGDVVAVNSLSLEVAQSETLILLGTSGSGKTTTLRMINRLIEPDSGDILLGGESIMAQNPVHLRRNIGYVIQSKGLFPHWTVAHNIATVPRLLGYAEKAIKERSNQLLEMVDLPPAEYLNRYPTELSGGQQQRVSLARALAADPELILMDEPFGALDPITRNQIRNEFMQLRSLINKTIVMVTHDVMEAIDMGDRIAVMNTGQLMQVGTAKQLLFSPANNFVHSFFNEDRFKAELKVIKLADILPILRDSEAADKTVNFSPQTDLYTINEQCSEQDVSHIKVESGNTYCLGSLLVAFQQYKRGLNE